MPKKIRILYHYHHYDPKVEAVAQEIEILKGYFQGSLFLADQGGVLPDWLELKSREKNVDLHHIYHPTLALRDFLRQYIFKLKKPVLLSIVTDPFSGNGKEKVLRDLKNLKSLSGIVVSDKKSKQKLEDLGLENVYLVKTGIKLEQFKVFHLQKDGILKLVMASSPHSEEGFELKGILLFLKALQEMENIKVYFLWRGKLEKEFWQHVDQYGVRDKVELVEGPLSVNQFLKDKQGMITPYLTLASNKAYPHSLIDALASGRAVLTSSAIPVSEIVQRERCGVVFEPRVDSIREQIEVFRNDFVKLSKAARRTAEKYFSEEGFIASYQRVYQEVLERKL